MIKNKLKELNFANQLKYTIFSMGRVKNLYGLFIAEITQNKLDHLTGYLEGENTLNDIFNKLIKVFPNFKKEEIKTDIEKSFSLAVKGEIHSSFQSTIATQTALLYASSLEFIISKDLDHFKDIQIYTSEIINIIESEIFYNATPNGDYNECELIIIKAIKLDEEHQLNVLNKIVDIEIDKIEFNILVEENKLVFNLD